MRRNHPRHRTPARTNHQTSAISIVLDTEHRQNNSSHNILKKAAADAAKAKAAKETAADAKALLDAAKATDAKKAAADAAKAAADATKAADAKTLLIAAAAAAKAVKKAAAKALADDAKALADADDLQRENTEQKKLLKRNADEINNLKQVVDSADHKITMLEAKLKELVDNLSQMIKIYN